jgi:hypothetical protein
VENLGILQIIVQDQVIHPGMRTKTGSKRKKKSSKPVNFAEKKNIPKIPIAQEKPRKGDEIKYLIS